MENKNNDILPSGVYTAEICELSLWKNKETGEPEIWFVFRTDEREDIYTNIFVPITTGAAIAEVNELLRSIVGYPSKSIKFESYKQYNDLLSEIFENYSDKKYKIQYNPNLYGLKCVEILKQVPLKTDLNVIHNTPRPPKGKYKVVLKDLYIRADEDFIPLFVAEFEIIKGKLNGEPIYITLHLDTDWYKAANDLINALNIGIKGTLEQYPKAQRYNLDLCYGYCKWYKKYIDDKITAKALEAHKTYRIKVSSDGYCTMPKDIA